MFGYFGFRALRDWWNRPVIMEIRRGIMSLREDVQAVVGVAGTLVSDVEAYIASHDISALRQQIDDLTRANGDLTTANGTLKSANDTLVSANNDLAAKVEVDDAAVQAAKDAEQAAKDAEQQAKDAKAASDVALNALQTTVDESDQALQTLRENLSDADAKLQAVPTPVGGGTEVGGAGGPTGTPGDGQGDVIPVPEPPPADLHR
jgi:methyl-accepting chemotaxis protein